MNKFEDLNFLSTFFKASSLDYKLSALTFSVVAGVGLLLPSVPYISAIVFGTTLALPKIIFSPLFTSWNNFLKKRDLPLEKFSFPWKSLLFGLGLATVLRFNKEKEFLSIFESYSQFSDIFYQSSRLRNDVCAHTYFFASQTYLGMSIFPFISSLFKSNYEKKLLFAGARNYSRTNHLSDEQFFEKVSHFIDNEDFFIGDIAYRVKKNPKKSLELTLKHVQKNELVTNRDSYISKKLVFDFVSKHDDPLQNFLFVLGSGINRCIPNFYAKKLVESQDSLETDVKSLLAHYFSITGFADLSDKLYEGLALDLQKESFTVQAHKMSTTKTLQKIISENDILSSSLLKRSYSSSETFVEKEFALQKELSTLDGAIRAPKVFGFFSNEKESGYYEQHLYDKTFRDYVGSLTNCSPQDVQQLADYVWSLRDQLLAKITSSDMVISELSLENKYLSSENTFISKHVLSEAIRVLESKNFKKSFLTDYHIDNLLVQETSQKTKPLIYKSDTSLKGKTYSVIDMVNFYGLLVPLLEEQRILDKKSSQKFLQNSYLSLKEPAMSDAEWLTGVIAGYVLKTESWMRAWSKQPNDSFHYTHRLAQLRHGKLAAFHLHVVDSSVNKVLPTLFMSEANNLEELLL